MSSLQLRLKIRPQRGRINVTLSDNCLEHRFPVNPIYHVSRES